jgi:hypothetical protein
MDFLPRMVFFGASRLDEAGISTSINAARDIGFFAQWSGKNPPLARTLNHRRAAMEADLQTLFACTRASPAGQVVALCCPANSIGAAMGVILLKRTPDDLSLEF